MSWLISMLVASLAVVGASDAPQPAPQPQVIIHNAAVKSAPQSQTQERFDQTYPIAPNGRVRLSNINGEVRVDVWDRNEVRVEAVKYIDCENPQDLDIDIDSTPNSIRIETEYGNKGENVIINSGSGNSTSYSYGYNNRCKRLEVDYKLTVPRTALINGIETVNGGILLNGLTNSVKASTVNGKMTAQNLRGTVNLSAVNGAIATTFASLDNVREIKIDTVNGVVDLQLPSDADMTLKVSTVNGEIANDFGLPVRKGEYVGRNLYGKVGDGSVAVRLNGVNGRVNIRRIADGRQVKPAINLLPQGEGGATSHAAPMPHTAPAPRPPRTQRPPRATVVAPKPPVVDVDVLNEEINRAVEESVKVSSAEAARISKEALKASKDALKLDKEKMRRELEKAREEIDHDIDIDIDIDIERDLNEDFELSMTERQGNTVEVQGTPNVRIDAPGGAVKIRGWDRQEVSYAIVRRGAMHKPEVSFQKNGADVNLKVGGNQAETFRLEVFVPRKTNLRVTTNREIRVEGVNGDLRLDGDRESVDVRESAGNLTVASRDGRVRVIGFNGAADVKTTGGNITLEGEFSKIATDTVSGETVLTLKDDASATLEATTKDVSFDGIEPNGTSRDTANSTVWRIGSGAATGKYKMRTTAGGKIYVRSASSVRIMRNFISNPQFAQIAE